MSALTRLRTGEIGLSLSERERHPGTPSTFGTGIGSWDFGPRLTSKDYPVGSLGHACLSRDEGNPEPLRAYRAKRGAAK